MNEWIRVKEEYPPLEISILVSYNKSVRMGMRFDDVSMRVSSGMFDCWIKITDDLFWMPLPSPPKENK